MKISTLIDHFSPFKGGFIKQYLTALGVKESDIDLYLHPNASCFDNPYGYKNITLGAEMLKEALDGKRKMGILVDCDCDGVMSATIAYDFLIHHNSCPILFFHTGKQHGLSISPEDNILQQVIDSGIDLLWIPDAGSENVDQCRELNEHGIKVLVTDHHPYKQVNPYAVVINNHDNDGKNYSLTGAGVTHKLVAVYYNQYNHEPMPYYDDLVAFSLVSDVADLSTLENRAFLYNANKHLENPFLIYLQSKLGRKENYTPHDIAWNLAPKINAVQRSSDMEAKEILFRAFVGEADFDKALSVAKKCHAQQSALSKEIYEEIDKTIDPSQSILVGFGEVEDKNYLGLAANKFVSQYHKPCILLREENSTRYSGSLRSPVDLASKINESRLALCMGHESACGIIVDKAKLDRLVKWFDSLGLDVEPSYSVAAKIRPKDITLDLCQSCEDYKDIWASSEGSVIIEPKFYCEAILTQDDLFFCGKQNNSIKFSIEEADFWKFKCNDTQLENFKKFNRFTIKMIITLSVNEWDGEKNPKALIEEFEIEEYKINFDEEWMEGF